MAKKKLKFYGTPTELMDVVDRTGHFGLWTDHGDKMTFKSATGQVLNWWVESKTINFQGKNHEQFMKLFLAVNYDRINQKKP